VGVRDVDADIGSVHRDRLTTTYGIVTDAVMRDGAPARDDSVPANVIDASSAAGYVMRPAASSYHSACLAISNDSHKTIRSMAIDQTFKLNYVTLMSIFMESQVSIQRCTIPIPVRRLI
jgi:hypothetical protein